MILGWHQETPNATCVVCGKHTHKGLKELNECLSRQADSVHNRSTGNAPIQGADTSGQGATENQAPDSVQSSVDEFPF